MSLLAVAQGHKPVAAASIIDMDLAWLPELPPDHRDYQRRLETRIKAQIQNDANRMKRYTITMQAWTKIYTLLKECTAVT